MHTPVIDRTRLKVKSSLFKYNCKMHRVKTPTVKLHCPKSGLLVENRVGEFFGYYNWKSKIKINVILRT